MTENVLETGETLNEGYEQVVRIPSGVMNLVRQSYDTREKVLDWMLAIFVSAALIYVFRGPILAMIKPSTDPNVGKTDVMPNQDVKEACGNINQRPPIEKIYTYNLPASRTNIASRVGPSSVRVPFNPGIGPQYLAVSEENEE